MTKYFRKELIIYIIAFLALIFTIKKFYTPDSVFFNICMGVTFLIPLFYIFGLARDYKMPESIITFLNAGYSKLSTVFLLGWNVILIFSLMTLIFFPLPDKEQLLTFFIGISFLSLYQISWIKFGIERANYILIIPTVIGQIIGALIIFFPSIITYFNINSLKIVLYSSILLIVLIGNVYVYYLFFKKDII